MQTPAQPYNNYVCYSHRYFVQVNHKGLELNGAYQYLLFTDFIILMEQSMNTVNNNTQALLYASKKAGLAVNVDKIKHVFASRNTKSRSNKYFKTAATVKDVGQT